MLIEREEGVYGAGPADIICILKLPVGTYHVAFFEEAPLPGPVKPIRECEILRLKSKMHHTTGSPTLEWAKQQFAALRKQIIVPDTNASDEPIEVDDPVNVWVVSNWLRQEKNFRETVIITSLRAIGESNVQDQS